MGRRCLCGEERSSRASVDMRTDVRLHSSLFLPDELDLHKLRPCLFFLPSTFHHHPQLKAFSKYAHPAPSLKECRNHLNVCVLKMASNSLSVETESIHKDNATLLGLPREVRDMIYHHVLRKEDPFIGVKTVLAKLKPTSDERESNQE